MNKKVKILVSVLSLVLLMTLFSLVAYAAGEAGAQQASNNTLVNNLITAESFSLRDDADAVGITARYSVNNASLKTLEESYYVTFGALVGRASDGCDQSTLRLIYSEKTGEAKAPSHAAMLTVYSTAGKHTPNGTFLTEKRDSFSATLNIGSKAVYRAKDGAVHLAFVLLEPKSDGGKAELFYVSCKDTSYGDIPSVEGVMQAEYNQNKGDRVAVDAYIDFLQTQIKDDVAVLSDTRVMICKDPEMASTLKEGERAIWVEYLPDQTPYPTAIDAVKRSVRAAYIYYPLDCDPSLEEPGDLADMGARRVFCYIADSPKSENAPGLVCVHGGGGNAYAEYALEAAKHGYAAIAIDTEGKYNMTGGSDTPYSSLPGAYASDSLGHGEKDNFDNAEKSLSEQWLYHAVMDTVLANTVLRSMDGVDENAVGITGISWGGLITSTALCYDHRYAFAAPVYISFHMAESHGISVGGLKTKHFANALWQDTELFRKCPVPTLIISCENDLFASVDTVSRSAKDLPNGTLLIKPGLLHGQQYGASLPEIYQFGYTVLGEEGGFITPKEAPTAEMDVRYTLELNIPEDAENVTATLYYLTEPLHEYESRTDIRFQSQELTVNDGVLNVKVPVDASLYYISFAYYDAKVDALQEGTPYLGSYLAGCEIEGKDYERGYVYSSTDLVFFN